MLVVLQLSGLSLAAAIDDIARSEARLMIFFLHKEFSVVSDIVGAMPSVFVLANGRGNIVYKLCPTIIIHFGLEPSVLLQDGGVILFPSRVTRQVKYFSSVNSRGNILRLKNSSTLVKDALSKMTSE